MTRRIEPARPGRAHPIQTGPTPPPRVSDAARVPSRAARAQPLRSGGLGAIAILMLNLLATILPDTAEAACTPASPVDGDTVTCTGADSTGFQAGAAVDLTINVDAGTTLDESDVAIDAAIDVNTGNVITVDASMVSPTTINILEALGFGIRGGDDNQITNRGDIVSTAANATGISVGNALVFDSMTMTGGNVVVSHNGSITLDGIGSIGIDAGNDYQITSSGPINLIGANARGIRAGSRTDSSLGGFINHTGTTTLAGTNSIGIEAQDDVRVFQQGTITVDGTFSTGISAGNLTSYIFGAASDSNVVSNSGTIFVNGDDSIGIQAGNGWFLTNLAAADPNAPTGAAIGNTGTPGSIALQVDGARAIGMSLGTDNLVLNQQIINVTGVDAIGISMGGNDLLDPSDSTRDGLFSLQNDGDIVGSADSGVLVEFTSAGLFENRVLNLGNITADLTNQGMANRAMAIVGSAADEIIENQGDIVGDIDLLGGNDVFRPSQASSYTGVIDGGAGTDIFQLADYTNPADTDPGDPSILNPALFTYDPATMLNFEEIEVGGGSNGWNIAGGGAFTGPVRVLPNGRLNVTTPTALGGNLDVQDGGIVQVRDTLSVAGALDLADNATLEVTMPLSVGGNFTVNPTSTVDVTLGDGSTALITVAGLTDLDSGGTNPGGNGTLIVREGPGLVSSPTPIPVIDATGGISGQFANLTIPTASATRIFTPIYDAAGLSIIFQTTSFANVAIGATARSIAGHFDALEAAGPTSDIDDVLTALGAAQDAATGTSILTAFSPEAYDAQTAVLAETSRRVSALLLDRPRDCDSARRDRWRDADAPLPCHARNWSPWLATIGSFRNRDGHGDHPRYDSTVGGAAFGIDSRPHRSIDLTVAIASQGGTVNVERSRESRLILTDLAGQIGWHHGGFRAQSVVGWGHAHHEDRRRTQYTMADGTLLTRQGQDDHDSTRASIAAETGYEIALGPIQIEPVAALQWTWIDQDGIDEKQAGDLGLRVRSRDDEIGFVNAGFRASTHYYHSRYISERLIWMDGVWRPEIDLRWRQYLSGDEREIEARLQGAPAGVPDFKIEGEEDSSGLEVGVGLTFTPEHANRLFVDFRYDAFIGSNTLEHDLLARIHFAF